MGSRCKTEYTFRTFVEGRIVDGRWKINEGQFRGCLSSFVKKMNSVAPSEYKFGVSLFTGCVVDVVGMSLYGCA